MAQITESTAKLADGHKVYTKTWRATAPEKARLLFLHGFSDHCNNYDDLFPHLASRGITVYSFDQRGWGRSVATKDQRGLTGPTTQVLEDISSMLRPLVESKADTTPVFLGGHSMGGAESLSYASLNPDGLMSKVRGTIALAPLIALHPKTRPNAVTVVAGRLAGRLLPKRPLVNKLDPSFLSRDEKKNKEWEEDPLNHDTGTLQGLAGMLDRGASLESGDWVLKEGVHEGGKTRMWVAHGDADKINEFGATETWVGRCKVEDKTFVPLQGWYHNLHIEPGHEKFRDDLADWILARSEPLTGSDSQAKL